MESLSAQGRLNAGQLNQVFEFQAALIHRAVAKLLQETLQGVSDSKAVQAVSFLDVVAM